MPATDTVNLYEQLGGEAAVDAAVSTWLHEGTAAGARGDVRSFAGWRVFLCGHPALVQALQKKVFLVGAKMKDISADALVMRASA